MTPEREREKNWRTGGENKKRIMKKEVGVTLKMMKSGAAGTRGFRGVSGVPEAAEVNGVE